MQYISIQLTFTFYKLCGFKKEFVFCLFVLCHHIIVNLFVRKPELNGANLPNFDLNSCHFCPSFFLSTNRTYKVQVNTRDALIRRIRNTAAKKKNGMKQLGKQQATFIDEAENI
jgi:hypothetical protein